jgi:hypothetical protein
MYILIIHSSENFFGYVRGLTESRTPTKDFFFVSPPTQAFGLILSAQSCKQMLGKKAQLNLGLS